MSSTRATCVLIVSGETTSCFGDLGVGETARDEHEDLALARGQLVQPGGGCGGRRVVADVGLDQPPGDRRGEQRVASRDRVDRGQQVLRRDVLEQEAAGAGDERVEHVLVEVEGGEHQHPRGRLAREQPPGRLEPVHDRHPDVHQDDVGAGPPAGVDGLRAVAGLGDDSDLRVGLEDHPEAGAHECLVVGDQDADGHAGTPASRGMRASRAKPWCVRLRAKLAVVERHALARAARWSVEVGDRAVAADLELEVARLVVDRDEAVADVPFGCGAQGCLDHAVGDEVDARRQVDRIADGMPLAREPGIAAASRSAPGADRGPAGG